MISPSSNARAAIVLLFMAALVGCDQATKQLAISQLKGTEARSYCGDVVRLQYAENPGAFLGLGGALPQAVRWFVLIAVNGAAAVAIVAALAARRQVSSLALAAWLMLAAGAIGNLIDRVRLEGRVVDFLNLGLGPLRTGIFNVADVAIMAGAILLMLRGLEHRRGEPRSSQGAN